MSPHETLFLDSTTRLVKNDIANSSFVQFEVRALGILSQRRTTYLRHVDTASVAVRPEATYGGCSALVWVIDAQDDHAEALARLNATIATAYAINPNIVFEVFVHKVDSFSDDQRIESQREIQQHLMEELAAARLQACRSVLKRGPNCRFFKLVKASVTLIPLTALFVQTLCHLPSCHSNSLRVRH
eukprot:6183313-Pleurochrysis_carterae.AAC.5